MPFQRRHPLFDPASLYGRMSSGASAEGKMRGYFHWIQARADREGLPAGPVGDSGRVSPSDRGANAVGAPGDVPAVLDTIRVGALLGPVRECSAEGQRFHSVPAEWVILAGPRTTVWAGPLGQQGHSNGEGTASRSSCRAFFFEPEVLQRLRSVLGEEQLQGPALLEKAFGRSAVAENLEVARILAGVPILQGELALAGGAGTFEFQSVPVPDRFVHFPPRQAPVVLVLLVDDETSPVAQSNLLLSLGSPHRASTIA